MLNIVALKGNLGADPEIKYFESGSSVTTFRLATKRFISQDKGYKTTWVTCKCWGKKGETINEKFRKGDPIAIQGFLDEETWEHEGRKESKLVVVVDDFEFCDGKKQP